MLKELFLRDSGLCYGYRTSNGPVVVLGKAGKCFVFLGRWI